MKELSFFDVIGPNMIGPSSSHTAGALRISLIARQLLKSKIMRVTFTLYGSLAKTYRGHGTDRALIGGMLGFGEDDPRIVDAYAIAHDAGLEYNIRLSAETPLHPNTVRLDMTGENGDKLSVTGVSIGGGNVEITNINGVEVRLTGEYNTILIMHNDVPGVLAHVTHSVSVYKINIAFMKSYREKRGELAYTLLEVDQPIAPPAVIAIEAHPDVFSAVIINI